LTLVFGGVEDAEEEAGQVHAEVGAVGGGAVFEVEAEGLALEQGGVFGEEAEQDADEEAFELVAGIAAGFEGVVEEAHDLGGFEIDGLLVLESVLFVAGDEGEGVNVFVEIGEREFEGAGLRMGRGGMRSY